jgi:hypothetical protein
VLFDIQFFFKLNNYEVFLTCTDIRVSLFDSNIARGMTFFPIGFDGMRSHWKRNQNVKRKRQ